MPVLDSWFPEVLSSLDPRTRGFLGQVVLGLSGHVSVVLAHVWRRGHRDEDRGVVPEGPQGGGQPGACSGGARRRGGCAGVRVVAGGGRPLPSGTSLPVVDQPEPAASGRLAPPARGRKARHAEVGRRRRRTAPAGPRHRRHTCLLQSSLRFVFLAQFSSKQSSFILLLVDGCIQNSTSCMFIFQD